MVLTTTHFLLPFYLSLTAISPTPLLSLPLCTSEYISADSYLNQTALRESGVSTWALCYISNGTKIKLFSWMVTHNFLFVTWDPFAASHQRCHDCGTWKTMTSSISEWHHIFNTIAKSWCHSHFEKAEAHIWWRQNLVVHFPTTCRVYTEIHMHYVVICLLWLLWHCYVQNILRSDPSCAASLWKLGRKYSRCSLTLLQGANSCLRVARRPPLVLQPDRGRAPSGAPAGIPACKSVCFAARRAAFVWWLANSKAALLDKPITHMWHSCG